MKLILIYANGVKGGHDPTIACKMITGLKAVGNGWYRTDARCIKSTLVEIIFLLLMLVMYDESIGADTPTNDKWCIGLGCVN